MEINYFFSHWPTLTAIRIEAVRNGLCCIALCVSFLVVRSIFPAAPYEQIPIDSIYSDLRQCYHAVDELDQALGKVACFRTTSTSAHPMLLQGLLKDNPNCVFVPFSLHDTDDAPQTTLWEAVVGCSAYNLFKLFLKSGTDFTTESRHADFFELIRKRNSFYIMFLEHTKKTMRNPEKVLDVLEEEGLVSTDTKGLIETFIGSSKEYLQNYRLAGGQRTLLDDAIQRYLIAEFMQDPLVIHWHPLKLLCDLDIPVRRDADMDVLQEKVREDNFKMNGCLFSTLCIGTTFIAIFAALVQPTALITVAPLELLIVAPIAASWYSRLTLLKHMKEWKMRRGLL